MQDYHASHWPGTSCAEIVICFLGGCGPRLIKKKIEDALTDGLTQVIRHLFISLSQRAFNMIHEVAVSPQAAQYDSASTSFRVCLCARCDRI